LRIAHVLTSFGLGGGERVALELAQGQKRRGHEVRAISLADGPDGPLGAEFRARGIEVSAVPKRGGFDPTLWARLAGALRGRRIELVHTHNQMPLIYAAPAGRLAGSKVVHTKHGGNFDGLRRRWLRRAAARMVHAYVAVSETTAAQASADGEAQRPLLRVIENGIDFAPFGIGDGAKLRARKTLGLAEGAFVVGTVGRVVAEKDHALLLRAVAPLLSERVQLVVIGDGPLLAELLAQKAGLGGVENRVHLLGARMDAASLYAAFDVFALSSRTEGLPLALLEAMASGLPVVASAVGGIPQVIEDGRTGRLVGPGDEVALREALSALAQDEALGLGWGRAAREQALARFSAERMLSDYMDLYEDVLGT
jgi:glycosyltransferase involved in cell wall biosynthesis